MKQKTISLHNVRIGNNRPMVVIAGPCVLTDEKEALRIATHCQRVAKKHGIVYIFKGSYDKANRTTIQSYRGPGIERGLEILRLIKDKLGVPVITDVHEVCDVDHVAEVVDILQIPAFLSRQTDLLTACAKTGRIVNVKKGQFLAPEDMKHIAEKIIHFGNSNIIFSERGTSFGYHNLVVDMRGIEKMKKTGFPVIFDATHSVQLPSGGKGQSSGEREYILPLAKASVALGIAGVFLETHPDPVCSRSDSASILPLNDFEKVIAQLKKIDDVVKI